jgi:hypothetical protein
MGCYSYFIFIMKKGKLDLRNEIGEKVEVFYHIILKKYKLKDLQEIYERFVDSWENNYLKNSRRFRSPFSKPNEDETEFSLICNKPIPYYAWYWLYDRLTGRWLDGRYLSNEWDEIYYDNAQHALNHDGINALIELMKQTFINRTKEEFPNKNNREVIEYARKRYFFPNCSPVQDYVYEHFGRNTCPGHDAFWVYDTLHGWYRYVNKSKLT